MNYKQVYLKFNYDPTLLNKQLQKLFKQSLTVPESVPKFKPLDNKSHKCNCDMVTLLKTGCTCGGI